MKRARDDLMLSSKVGREIQKSETDTDSDSEITYAKNPEFSHAKKQEESVSGRRRRVFECKTCNRQFPSFQALGGHRASHKKLKMLVAADEGHGHTTLSPSKPKMHKCSICGLQFTIGQALGGHMRRHRQAAAPNNTSTDHVVGSSTQHYKAVLLKKSTSYKRVFEDLDLDLRLGPPGS